MLFDRICLETTEFLAGRLFDTLGDAQAALDAWVIHYNTERPHQGIVMATPARWFTAADPSARPLDATALDRTGDA